MAEPKLEMQNVYRQFLYRLIKCDNLILETNFTRDVMSTIVKYRSWPDNQNDSLANHFKKTTE